MKKDTMKEHFKKINTKLEKVLEQAVWSMHDTSLRSHVRRHILVAFLPTYSDVWEKYQRFNLVKNPYKYFKYAFLPIVHLSFFWLLFIWIYRYVSLYRTPLSRNTRYTGCFSGDGNLHLDWIVLPLTGIHDKSDTFATPDQSGLTRHTCISLCPCRLVVRNSGGMLSYNIWAI